MRSRMCRKCFEDEDIGKTVYMKRTYIREQNSKARWVPIGWFCPKCKTLVLT